jgi:hypothetical protein
VVLDTVLNTVLDIVRQCCARLGCADSGGTTALHLAALAASVTSPPQPRIALALAECASASQRATWCDHRGCTPLHYAAFADDAQLIIALSSFGCGALNACAVLDQWGRTPRTIASALGHEQAAEALRVLERESSDARWCAAHGQMLRCEACAMDVDRTMRGSGAQWDPRALCGSAAGVALGGGGGTAALGDGEERGGVGGPEKAELAKVGERRKRANIAVGSDVVLCGLRTAALNGARGVVLTKCAGKDERYGVQVVHPRTGAPKRVSVRRRHLHVVISAAVAADDGGEAAGSGEDPT